MSKDDLDNVFFLDFAEPDAACDSEGNALTKAQENFFRQSKCVDEYGNLFLVYHAGNSKYDSFDKERIGVGAGSIYGKGFYFSCDPESVKIYGSVIRDYYLNLKNPFRYEAEDIEEDILYNVETFIEVLERNNFQVSPELKAAMEQDVLENDGGLDTLIEMTCGAEKAAAFFQTCGFDGIMNLNTLDFVAFEPNQVKLTSNKSPTSSVRLTASFKR